MLKSLTPGQKISDRFGVIGVTEKTTSGGAPYLVVELSHPSGTISGKVWSDAMPNVQLKEGGVAEIQASVDQYRGVNNFNITHARHVLEEELDKYLSENPTLVFDIETVGKEFKELDEEEQNYLENNLEKNFEGTKKQKQDRTGLYPMFGFVVAIGMWNPGSGKGMVYYLEDIKNQELKIKNGESEELEKYDNENFQHIPFAGEKSLLEAFWETALKYERYVTYNGSGFDFPFLVFRSGVHRIKVPFETHGSYDKFVDLAQRIKVNNRSIKLEQVCKSFGIDNPKKKGVSGMEVANLFRKGRLKEILEYVGRDVVATSELYRVWKTYLAGKVVV
jgi:DNA polymerase elongation subunit (family B)